MATDNRGYRDEEKNTVQKSDFQIEEEAYEESAKKLIFSSTIRTISVLISLITILPIGLISLFFWIRGKKRWNKGEKRKAADDYAEAENMALTSISFGLLGVLTVLICIEQLKRNLKTVYAQ